MSITPTKKPVKTQRTSTAWPTNAVLILSWKRVRVAFLRSGGKVGTGCNNKGIIVMADKSLLHLCSLTVLHIAPLGWEHISFNGDYDHVWSSQSLKQGFRQLEIRAPPSSMPLSVRFGTILR
jgi:hypothetical protein